MPTSVGGLGYEDSERLQRSAYAADARQYGAKIIGAMGRWQQVRQLTANPPLGPNGQPRKGRAYWESDTAWGEADSHVSLCF